MGPRLLHRGKEDSAASSAVIHALQWGRGYYTAERPRP
jgi:hypothetical protein